MSQSVRKAASFLCVFLFSWFFIRFALPIGLPFVLGGVLAALSEPAALRLSRCRVPRAVCAGIAVTMTLGILSILTLTAATWLIRQMGILARILPDMASMAVSGINSLQLWLLELAGRLPSELSRPLEDFIRTMGSGGTSLLDQGVRWVLGVAGGVICAIPGSALSLLTGLLAAYMISAELPAIRQYLRSRISADKRARLRSHLLTLRRGAGLWLISQVKLSCVTFGILAVGLTGLRISFSIGWAAVICLVDAFPVLGIGTVLLPWSLISFLQADPARAAGLLGLYITAALVRSILEPKLVGNHLGLDPLVTLAALYSGFRLWGVAGMMVMPMVAMGAVGISRQEG